MQMARIGLFYDEKAALDRWTNQENVFERYMIEVLEHARIPYQLIDSVSAFHEVDILIVGLASDDQMTKDALLSYTAIGGIVISYGGLDFLSQDLGCKLLPTVSKGYAGLEEDFAQADPLRFLEAYPWECLEPEKVSEKGTIKNNPSLAALQQIPVGKGFIDRWAINIPKTIVGFQQGTAPVTVDGMPAPDGTANLDEGILKADDGFELDWVIDRELTETGMPYFSLPYADLWREVILEHLIRRSLDLGLTIPLIEQWPASIDHIAMISHDSDLNVDESAEITLQVLKEEDVQSTWCMIAPGYSPSVYEKIKKDGHELAFHYNALEKEDGIWSEKEFLNQLNWLKKAINESDITSNKNHYTRFEGWGELFRWCEEHGIEVDQTRGPSKKGNVGFLFGTSHPYFPIALSDERNRFYDVLEIGFLTQDLNHEALSDTSIIQPFLEKVKRVNGVAHFLFHQFHIYNQPKVKDAIIHLIKAAKSEGFTFWTSKQINDWERARRQIQISATSGELQLHSPIETEDVVVWTPVNNLSDEEEYIFKYGVGGINKVHKVKSITVEL